MDCNVPSWCIHTCDCPNYYDYNGQNSSRVEIAGVKAPLNLSRLYYANLAQFYFDTFTCRFIMFTACRGFHEIEGKVQQGMNITLPSVN